MMYLLRMQRVCWCEDIQSRLLGNTSTDNDSTTAPVTTRPLTTVPDSFADNNAITSFLSANCSSSFFGGFIVCNPDEKALIEPSIF